jgi:hypothetical protein
MLLSVSWKTAFLAVNFLFRKHFLNEDLLLLGMYATATGK